MRTARISATINTHNHMPLIGFCVSFSFSLRSFACRFVAFNTRARTVFTLGSSLFRTLCAHRYCSYNTTSDTSVLTCLFTFAYESHTRKSYWLSKEKRNFQLFASYVCELQQTTTTKTLHIQPLFKLHTFKIILMQIPRMFFYFCFKKNIFQTYSMRERQFQPAKVSLVKRTKNYSWFERKKKKQQLLGQQLCIQNEDEWWRKKNTANPIKSVIYLLIFGIERWLKRFTN